MPWKGYSHSIMRFLPQVHAGSFSSFEQESLSFKTPCRTFTLVSTLCSIREQMAASLWKHKYTKYLSQNVDTECKILIQYKQTNCISQWILHAVKLDRRIIQINELLTMQSSPASGHFIPLMSKYSSKCPVLKWNEMFENKALRKIYELKWDEVIRGRRKQQNESSFIIHTNFGWEAWREKTTQKTSNMKLCLM